MPAPNHDFSNQIDNFWYSLYYPVSGTQGQRSANQPMGRTTSFWDNYQVASVRVPGFKRLKASQLPWNEYNKQQIIVRDPMALYVQKATVQSGYYFEYYNSNAAGLSMFADMAHHPDAVPDYPIQKVVSSLIEHSKLGRAQTGIAAAEAYKTAAHLAHTATRIAGALKALRSCRFGDFMSALGVTASRRKTDRFYSGVRANHGSPGKGFLYDKRFTASREAQESKFHDFMSKTWLEYTYGWKPLLQDTYEHAKAFAEIFTDHSGVWRVAKARSKVDKTTNKRINPGVTYHEYAIECSRFVEIVVQYRIPDGVVNPAVVFGLTNPASIAWELVPFSFVADWFIPIGSALENLTAYQGLEFHRGIQMLRSVYYNRGRIVDNGLTNANGGVVYKCITAEQNVSYFQLNIVRSRLDTFPAYGWPQMKNPSSVRHAASALALLQSLFTKNGHLRL